MYTRAGTGITLHPSNQRAGGETLLLCRDLLSPAPVTQQYPDPHLAHPLLGIPHKHNKHMKSLIGISGGLQADWRGNCLTHGHYQPGLD